MSYGNYGNSRNYGNNSYGGGYNRDRSYGRSFDDAPRREPEVEVKKPPLDPKSRDLVQFKGSYHAVETILAQAKSGPVVEFDTNELHPTFLTIATQSRDFAETLNTREPIFVKYEGKFVVLLGLRNVIDHLGKEGLGKSSKIKGRLLSTPALKRCIVE